MHELSSESLKLLSDHVDYLKSVVDDGQQDEITALAIDNGENLLNTMSVMTFKKL